jgi:DNA polymerase
VSGAIEGGGEARRALAEWVAYLKDIGVKELSAGAAEAGDPIEKLREIREEIGDCTRCKLHAARTNIVFGVGNPRARLMFVGEGPGADEDARGEPFVGRAGRKLDEMIRSIGLEREEVYIANVVKCRPPDNRTPEPDEIATCVPFLFAQIEAIRPKVIVALGAPATKTLLGTRIGITQIRGTWGTFREIPVMPTFHPAYLLRVYTEENRRKVWDDLKAARAKMDASP